MGGRTYGTRLMALAILVALLAGTMTGALAYFIVRQASATNDLCTWSCALWEQTSQADFENDTVWNVSITASPGDVVLDKQRFYPNVYGLSGNGGTAFSMYNVSNSSWVTRQATPANVVIGGSLVYADNGTLFAFRGGATTFWEYNISRNTWTTKAPVANNAGTGASLVYPAGNRSIYATRGGGQTTFWEYNISTNIWRVRQPALATIGAGGSLTWPEGNNSIYAFRGGTQTAFYEYNMTTNVWRARQPAPATVQVGGALAYIGNGNISALRGGGTTTFWIYNISSNTWNTRLPAAPIAVNTGGALAYTGDGNVSAFSGGATVTTFWRYNVSGNTTQILANVPTAVGAGGSLAYVPPLNPWPYETAGTLISDVKDTGIGGARWYNLIWSSTINPGVTNVTFQVRASDSSFSAGNTTLSWINASWPSPVTTGLPSGRYFQWRAILTTNNLAQTPTLHDVALCYS